MLKGKRALSTARLVRIAIFVALIIVGAFIKIPIGAVPVSLQMTFCIACALLLGGKDCFFCIAIYIFMGIVGIPVFTSGGGFAYVFQPTFGYLLGFLIGAPICGFVARGLKCDKKLSKTRFALGCTFALFVVYIVGVFYMYLMLGYLQTPVTLADAWLTGCAVFLPSDIVLCIVSCIVAYCVLKRYGINFFANDKYNTQPYERE